ncbi:MAG TPA: type II secretion system F family protein [Stellaceae bacterium]|nr:type II secretion system F family protein [Stellaceae bacterium]
MMVPIDPATLIALGAGLLAALTMFLGVAAYQGVGSRRYWRRLQAVTDRKASRAVRRGAEQTRSLTRRQSATPGIDRVFHLLPRRAALVERLSKTGHEISVGQYMIATIIAIVIFTGLILLFVKLPLVLSALFGVALGIFVPHYVAGRMGRRRVQRFYNLFPEAIDLMVRALRAGLPITEAIINAGHEIGDPIGPEFRSIEAGMKLGRDLDSLLWDIAKRITLPEMRFFIIALSVQRETGGNLAETLNNLSEVLRRRRAMRAKARAMASEARASTIILGSLPVLVAIMLVLTSPTYIMPMFHDVRGLVMLAIAVGMLLLGVGIMVKMARFEI